MARLHWPSIHYTSFEPWTRSKVVIKTAQPCHIAACLVLTSSEMWQILRSWRGPQCPVLVVEHRLSTFSVNQVGRKLTTTRGLVQRDHIHQQSSAPETHSSRFRLQNIERFDKHSTGTIGCPKCFMAKHTKCTCDSLHLRHVASDKGSRRCLDRGSLLDCSCWSRNQWHMEPRPSMVPRLSDALTCGLKDTT